MKNNNVKAGYTKPRGLVGIIVFILVGLFAFGFGIYKLIPNKYDKSGILITATIETLDGGERDFPTVSFVVDGVKYSGEINERDDSMKIGDKIDVLYMSDDPNDFVIAPGQSYTCYLLIAFGLISIIAGGFVINFINKKSLYRIYKIKQNATLVKCFISGFEMSKTYHNSDNMGYTVVRIAKITCKDSHGNIYTQNNYCDDVIVDYTKLNYGYDFGDQINVYVSNTNPKKYAIDVVEFRQTKLEEIINKQNGDIKTEF